MPKYPSSSYPNKFNKSDKDRPQRFRRNESSSPVERKQKEVQNETPFPWVQLRTQTYQPFVYQKMVFAKENGINSGDLVSIFNKQGELFAYGYYNTHSMMALRILAYANEKFEDEYELLAQRISKAIAFRKDILKLHQESEAYRLIHAEGDQLPGLIVESYGNILVGEIFSLAIFQRRAKIEEILLAQTDAEKIYWRADQKTQDHEGFSMPADEKDPGSLIIKEHGLRFRVNLKTGHKTGFFCDQRENRKKLCDYTREAEVLDVCSYTGGFGIYAKSLGEAKAVTSVDLDEDSVALAKHNANLNQQRIRFVHADCFPFLRQMQENKTQFDVVVLDPPKFILNRDGYTLGRQKYLDLNKLGMSVVRPGGFLITCSCSGLMQQGEFIDLVKQASHIEHRKVQLLETTGPGADHPTMLDWPEASYLKVLWLRIL